MVPAEGRPPRKGDKEDRTRTRLLLLRRTTPARKDLVELAARGEAEDPDVMTRGKRAEEER